MKAKELLKTKELLNTKDFAKTKKGKIIIGIGAIVLLLLIAILSQYPASTKKVFKEYKETYDVAVFEKYYDGKGLFGKLEVERALEVIEMAQADLNMLSVSSTGGTIEDKNNVEIEKVKINSKSYSSNYVDIDTTIKNNSSKSISYIKINLYFKDSNGVIVSSSWTNDNATIKPGATQIISKMIEKDGWYSVSAEIDDIRFK